MKEAVMNRISLLRLFNIGVVWVLLLPGFSTAQSPTELSAFHRSGQTFLTWREVEGNGDEFYRIYRYDSPITQVNLGSATVIATIPDSSAMYLTERWMTDYGYTPVQQNYIINDLGSELEDTQGLFVNTLQSGEEGTAFYAVTSIVSGSEDTQIAPGQNSLTIGVVEEVDDPLPVLVWQSANGKAMVFTQFMDFRNWNPTFDGYIYNYFVSLPDGFDQETAYPLILHIEGHGTRYVDAFWDHGNGTGYEWPVIQVWGDDPHQSWYYGYAKDHSWGDNWPQYVWGDLPNQPESGRVSNFTEQRLLTAVYDVIDDPRFTVDENRIYAYGHSMGGSGSLALGMRYPDVFAAVYCSEPMTKYDGSELWFYDLVPKWGLPFYELTVINEGPHATHLRQYDGMDVWEWMNHRFNMVSRQGDDMAYISTYHGTYDDVIDWETQGEPWYNIMSIQERGWTGAALPLDHTWYGFLDTPNFTFGDFSFRKDRSYPGFSNYSLNFESGDTLAYYNHGIEWSCEWNDFAGSIVDSPDRWEVTLRLYDPWLPGFESVPDEGSVDVTTRRVDEFLPPPGTQCYWLNYQLPDNTEIQRGQTTPSDTGIVTITDFTVTKAGNRLIISTSTPADGNPVPAPDVLWVDCTPVPSHSTVSVTLDLPRDGTIDVRIYDIRGNLIKILERATYTAGQHIIPWDGRTADGDPVPAGVYFCRVETIGESSVTKKLIMVH